MYLWWKFKVTTAGRMVSVSEYSHVLIPKTSEYAMWQRRIKVVNQQTLRWGVSLGLFRWTLFNHKGPSKWKRELEERTKELETDLKMLWCWLWRWRGGGPLAKEYRQPLKAGKGKEMDSLWEPAKGTQPCWHLDVSPVRPMLGFLPTEL